MEYAVVIVPAAPLRRKPDHRREMTNQLLFGEKVRCLKTRGQGWVKICSLHDGYEGWITGNSLRAISSKEANEPARFYTAALFSELRLGDTRLIIPAGSALPAYRDGKGEIGGLTYYYEGFFADRNSGQLSSAAIDDCTHPWLNAPYLWGGRTVFGIDCSGFVQVVFRLLGHDLPRDAWQQAQEGKPVKKLKEASPGDLAFFDDRDEIVHVGIMLSSDQIIHASGKVRIDPIDKKGIVHAETGKRTHQLRSIRRIGAGISTADSNSALIKS